MDLQFTQFYPMPGAQNKFHIIYDDVSRLFWMTTNLVVDSQNSQGWLEKLYKMGFYGPLGNERRILMLMYSMDALNWFQTGRLVLFVD